MTERESNTVLVVEDEPLIRLDLVGAPFAAGFTVLEASSSAEAIEVLETNPEVQVVFTDIQMPGRMDGIALAAYVRKRWPPTMIIVSSGKVCPAPNTLAADMVFLSKPYDMQKLDELLRELKEQLRKAPA